MALDSQPPFTMAFGERPRIEVPSRTSSLNRISRPINKIVTEKSGFSNSRRQAEASKTAQTSASSLARVNHSAKRQSKLVDPGFGAEAMKHTSGPTNPSRRLSTASVTAEPMATKPYRRSASCSATSRKPARATQVKRFEGATRTVSEWDDLRRDPELWFDDGDCYVHLYARGQSRRGPSFRVPFSTLNDSNCGALFSLCFAQVVPGGTSGMNTPRASYSGSTTPMSMPNACELYIPAPDESSREDSFNWHLTTRNFFAMIFRKPLVGTSLGKSLVDLQERMHLFRSGQINNHRDFMVYAEEQGYREYVDCADYALAFLYYAEHYRLNDIWIDAFAHCVGMNDILYMSEEFEPVSRVSKALITRAYLEMDLHLGHVTAALSHFLEDDLSSTYLGLGQGARTHLDRFRSFLHSFYVEKFGYWPPPVGSTFSKALYKSMYFDFQNLYNYLVDRDSTDSISSQKPASGGICVLQNVQAFDKRHKYEPLPHPLPLLPEAVSASSRTHSQKGLLSFKLGTKQAKTDKYMTARAALTTATNTRDISVTSSSLVKAYMRFERECARNQREEKVSLADARKVRWILIYGALQYLVSAIRSPKEVRDTEEPEYPLCCLVAGTPPWNTGVTTLKNTDAVAVDVPDAIDSYLASTVTARIEDTTSGTERTSIQPDCEAGEFLTHTNIDPDLQRTMSVEMPAPLRITSPQILRNSSIRSLKKSFSPFGSRRNSVIAKAPTASFCEIIVHGYGNGLNETIIDGPSELSTPRAASPMRSLDMIAAAVQVEKGARWNVEEPEAALQPTPSRRGRGLSRRPTELELNCTPIPEAERTPTLEAFQVDHFFGPNTPDSSRDSPSSTISTARQSTWSRASSTSSASSADPKDYTKSSIEASGLLGGLVQVDSNICSPISPTSAPQHGVFSFDFGDDSFSRTLTNEYSISSNASDVEPDNLNSSIGVAISDPLVDVPLHSNEKVTMQEKSQILIKGFSQESLLLPQSDHQKKESVVDIYAALQMPSANGSKVRFLGNSVPEAVGPAPSVRKPTGFEKAKKQERRRSLIRRW